MCARTHLMFSHTAKGQTYNTALLSKFLAEIPAVGDPLLPRLIDFEFLTDEHGKRTVGFGWFAGGMHSYFPPVAHFMMYSCRRAGIVIVYGPLSFGNWSRVSLSRTFFGLLLRFTRTVHSILRVRTPFLLWIAFARLFEILAEE